MTTAVRTRHYAVAALVALLAAARAEATPTHAPPVPSGPVASVEDPRPVHAAPSLPEPDCTEHHVCSADWWNLQRLVMALAVGTTSAIGVPLLGYGLWRAPDPALGSDDPRRATIATGTALLIASGLEALLCGINLLIADHEVRELRAHAHAHALRRDALPSIALGVVPSSGAGLLSATLAF
jgi:hypothetical protein